MLRKRHKLHWKKEQQRLKMAVVISVLCSSLGIYMSTARLCVGAGHAAEFAASACSWGIVHSPGYPLYSIISGVFVRLLNPLLGRTAAFRLGILNSLLSSFGNMFLSLTVLHLTSGERFYASIISISFHVFSPSLWYWTTTAEPVAMTYFLSCVLLYLLVRHVLDAAKKKRKKPSKWMMCFGAFFAGLSLAHQQLLILFVVPMLFFVIYHDVMREHYAGFVLTNFIPICISFLLGLLPYLYIPLVSFLSGATRLLLYDGVDSLRGFLDHVLFYSRGTLVAGTFHNEVNWYGYPSLHILSLYVKNIHNGTVAVGFWMAVYGAFFHLYENAPTIAYESDVSCYPSTVASYQSGSNEATDFTLSKRTMAIGRIRTLIIVMWLTFLCTAVVLVRVDVGNVYVRSMLDQIWQVPLPLVAILCAMGVDTLLEKIKGEHSSAPTNAAGPTNSFESSTHLVVVAVLFVVALGAIIVRYVGFDDQHADHITEFIGRKVLATAPLKSVMFAASDEFLFPIIYLQECEGIRRDITVMHQDSLSAFKTKFHEELIVRLCRRACSLEEEKCMGAFLRGAVRERLHIIGYPAPSASWSSKLNLLQGSDSSGEMPLSFESWGPGMALVQNKSSASTWSYHLVNGAKYSEFLLKWRLMVPNLDDLGIANFSKLPDGSVEKTVLSDELWSMHHRSVTSLFKLGHAKEALEELDYAALHFLHSSRNFRGYRDLVLMYLRIAKLHEDKPSVKRKAEYALDRFIALLPPDNMVEDLREHVHNLTVDIERAERSVDFNSDALEYQNLRALFALEDPCRDVLEETLMFYETNEPSLKAKLRRLRTCWDTKLSESSARYLPKLDGLHMELGRFRRIRNTPHGSVVYDLRADFHVGASIDLFGVYEDIVSRLLSDIIEEGDTVVDIGCHIGTHTLVMAHAVGITRGSGSVIAIEPQESLFRLAVTNMVLNGFSDSVQLIHSAVSDHQGWISLPEKDGLSSLESPDDMFEATSITVDSLQLEKCSMIKIDMPGLEGKIALGSLSTLKRANPILVVEPESRHGFHKLKCLEEIPYSGSCTLKGESTVGNFVRILDGVGYICYFSDFSVAVERNLDDSILSRAFAVPILLCASKDSDPVDSGKITLSNPTVVQVA